MKVMATKMDQLDYTWLYIAHDAISNPHGLAGSHLTPSLTLSPLFLLSLSLSFSLPSSLPLPLSPPFFLSNIIFAIKQ